MQNHKQTNKQQRNKQQKRKYYYKRRYNRFRIATYPISTKPATFGPGTYYFAASKLLSGSFENQILIRMYTNILIDSPEFGRVISDFKYIKCTGLSLTFYARNLPVSTNMTPAFFIVNFDGDPTENLRLQDNVKRVSAYLTNDRVFKYKIPNINCQYGGSLNNFRSITDLSGYDDIIIQIHAPDNTSNWYVKIDVFLMLKGPTNAATKLVEEDTAKFAVRTEHENKEEQKEN